MLFKLNATGIRVMEKIRDAIGETSFIPTKRYISQGGFVGDKWMTGLFEKVKKQQFGLFSPYVDIIVELGGGRITYCRGQLSIEVHTSWWFVNIVEDRQEALPELPQYIFLCGEGYLFEVARCPIKSFVRPEKLENLLRACLTTHDRKGFYEYVFAMHEATRNVAPELRPKIKRVIRRVLHYGEYDNNTLLEEARRLFEES